ncbi:MAG: carbon-nitrogen hydrolase family protein, partial [Firmicutes bacterium]|nr:carbon-nitrogen hydrolase family protein [Bacillota bacterium]
MKLAMAQMRMDKDVQKNIEASVKYIEEAVKGGADLVLFPEVQLTQFFPKFEGRDATALAVTLDGPEVAALKNACRENKIWASPNVYLKKDGNYYDCSLMIDADGDIRGISKMVYIYQAEDFYEQDYYHPSEDGFIVYDTPFGKVGIVICFDRHMPESIRSCAMQGAELVL